MIRRKSTFEAYAAFEAVATPLLLIRHRLLRLVTEKSEVTDDFAKAKRPTSASQSHVSQPRTADKGFRLDISQLDSRSQILEFPLFGKCEHQDVWCAESSDTL